MCRAGRRKVTASERARRRAAGRSGSGRRRAGHGPGAAISAGQAPVRTADIAAVSRGLNSNKVVGMTGISANAAARAPGRAGALGRVEGARGGHQAHMASGGGQRGLAACGAAHQQHRIARPGRRGRRTRGRPRAGPSTISSSLSGVTAERPWRIRPAWRPRGDEDHGDGALIAVAHGIARQGSSTRYPNGCAASSAATTGSRTRLRSRSPEERCRVSRAQEESWSRPPGGHQAQDPGDPP